MRRFSALVFLFPALVGCAGEPPAASPQPKPKGSAMTPPALAVYTEDTRFRQLVLECRRREGSTTRRGNGHGPRPRLQGREALPRRRGGNRALQPLSAVDDGREPRRARGLVRHRDLDFPQPA